MSELVRVAERESALTPLGTEMVAALGVNQKWLFTSVFALGVFLAALGGALQIPRDAVNHAMDLRVIVEVFVVVVIGGLGSIIDAADKAKVEIGVSDLQVQNLGLTGAKFAAVLKQNIEDVKNQAGIVADDLDATAQELADKINKIWEAGDGSSAASERVKQITDLMEESRKAAQGSGQDFKAQADAAKAAQDAADRAASEYEKYAA